MIEAGCKKLSSRQIAQFARFEQSCGIPSKASSAFGTHPAIATLSCGRLSVELSWWMNQVQGQEPGPQHVVGPIAARKIHERSGCQASTGVAAFSLGVLRCDLPTQGMEAMDATHTAPAAATTESFDANGPKERVTLCDLERSFLHARRKWTGCCWPTCLGPSRCDANGLTSSQLTTLANATVGEESTAWSEVASWLRVVEFDARLAAEAGLRSIEAAREGHLEEALRHADEARLREHKYGYTNGWLQFRALVGEFVAAGFPSELNVDAKQPENTEDGV